MAYRELSEMDRDELERRVRTRSKWPAERPLGNLVEPEQAAARIRAMPGDLSEALAGLALKKLVMCFDVDGELYPVRTLDIYLGIDTGNIVAREN